MELVSAGQAMESVAMATLKMTQDYIAQKGEDILEQIVAVAPAPMVEGAKGANINTYA